MSASQELATRQAEQQLNLSQIASKKVEVALKAAREANNLLAQVKQTIRIKNKKFRLHKNWLAVIVLLITTFNYLISLTGGLQSGELLIFDRFIQMRPPQPVEQRIVIIAIDEQDIQYLQEYPLSNWTLAKAIEQLQSDRPMVCKISLSAC